MTKFYAGVGSRETPEDILARMTKCAVSMRKNGLILRSGGAKGADSAFEDGAGKHKEIFTANGHIPLWTNVMTDFFHPAPDKLSDYARKLMNRNSLILLGEDGNTPVEFVVCWTKNGEAVGGSGQAIRMAEYFGIKVFNFYNESDIVDLKKFVRGGDYGTTRVC